MNVYLIFPKAKMYKRKSILRIGIDFDNTIAKPKEFVGKVAARRLGLKEYIKKHSYDFRECPNEMREMIFSLFSDPEYMGDLIALPGAITKLASWKKEGCSIVLITNRDDHLKEITDNFISTHFPMIEKSIYVGSGNSKIEEMKSESIDAWVDDSPTEVWNALKLKLDTCLISNSDTNYNWHIRGKFPGRVFSRVADINF